MLLKIEEMFWGGMTVVECLAQCVTGWLVGLAGWLAL